MKVHSRLRMPSERFSSLTRRMTRKSRKNVMETEAFSDAYGQKEPKDFRKRKHIHKKGKNIAGFNNGKVLAYRNYLHRICLLHIVDEEMTYCSYMSYI